MMIRYVDIKEKYDDDDNLIEEVDYCQTTGCNCCSSDLYFNTDRKEIIEDLQDNIEIIGKVCEKLNLHPLVLQNINKNLQQLKEVIK